MKILFVLRGRPGLGHIMPGLAIALQAVSRGHQALILTYGNGVTFLSQSSSIDWQSISISNEYTDWPGLNLYDHGLRVIAPIVEDFDADLIVLGGEYLLAPLQDIVKRPCVMLFNPEIMEKNERNLMPTRLFLALFKHCQFLAPLQPLHSNNYFDTFLSEKNRILPEGPYVPFKHNKQKNNKSHGQCVLIANGGGICFPSSTQSYSSAASDPQLWIEETRQMTLQAIKTTLHYLSAQGKVIVYSCLGDKGNKQLLAELTQEQSIEIHPPSMSYYKVLSEANIVISRAGTGFIADVQTISAEVILWCLPGHDEQRDNAQRLCANRKSTFFADDTHQLEKLIIETIERKTHLKKLSPTVLDNKNNSMLIMQHLEQALSFEETILET